MFGISFESVKAQVPQNVSYQKVSGIKSISIGNWDTTYILGNTSELYGLPGRVPAWIDIIEKPGFVFITTSRNYFDLINKTTLFDGTWISLTREPSIRGFGIIDTLNGKWAILAGKPTFGTSGYNNQSTKTNKPTLSDNKWYRLAGDLYNANLDVKYPLRPKSNAIINTKYPIPNTPKK
jgi:hypothetical protein